MVDDFGGYKQLFTEGRGITELGCWAHARRKFFDLHEANKSPIAAEALRRIGELYAIERQGRELNEADRVVLRQDESRPLLTALHQWLATTRKTVADGSGTAKAMDYTLKRWPALERYAQSGIHPIGRVEMWRGNLVSHEKLAPFPHPAHRTGRADFPHPALFQIIRPSHSASRAA